MTTHTTFDTLTLSIPAHWLPCIFNDDASGLDDAEEARFVRWALDLLREFGPCSFELSSPDGDDRYAPEPYFARYHDAAEYGVLACNCYDVQVFFRPADVLEAA